MPAIIDGTNTSTFPGVDGVTMLEGGVAMPRMVLSTAQNTTSGTAITFSSLPSWVKRITMMFDGVSTNGTSLPIVRLGTSGGVVATGYITSGFIVDGAAAIAAFTNTTGLPLSNTWLAAGLARGQCVFNNLSGNTWTYSLSLVGTTSNTITAAGIVPLGGTLDRIQLTTVGGADTFDAGSVNVMYEG